MTETKTATEFVNRFGVEPRDLTPAQRRELFNSGKNQYGSHLCIQNTDALDELIPFHNLTLDHVLRLHGLARDGTVYQIHGEAGDGQSLLGHAILRGYQKSQSEPVAIFNFAHAIEPDSPRVMGMDASLTFLMRPDSIDSSVREAVQLMKRGVRVFMFDSIPQMQCKARGTHDRNIARFYDVILPHLAANDATLVMINQTRPRIEIIDEDKIEVKGYPPVTQLDYLFPGGVANRDAISVMIDVKTVNQWLPGGHPDEFILGVKGQRGEEYAALEVRLRTLKNKVTYTDHRQGTSWIRAGSGFDESISIRQLGRQLGLIASHDQRWFVGEALDAAIAVYDDKASAIQDLVTKPNSVVLEQLKSLIINKLSADAGIGAIRVADDHSPHHDGVDDRYDSRYVPVMMTPRFVDEDAPLRN